VEIEIVLFPQLILLDQVTILLKHFFKKSEIAKHNSETIKVQHKTMKQLFQ
jgi:hypothetical protein